MGNFFGPTFAGILVEKFGFRLRKKYFFCGITLRKVLFPLSG